MPLILPANTLSTGGFSVANSCRFNDGDSAYMYRSNGTPTSQRILTISTWLKRGTDMATTDVYQYWMGIQDTGVGDPRMYIGFNDSGQLNTGEKDGAGENVWKFTTNRVFRDPSAWMNIVLSIDTTQGTEANRVKIYVNGTQETSFATSTYPTENLDMDTTGNEINVACIDNSSPSGFFDGYIAEMVYSDGQAYAASDFGEFDEDSPTIWKPKDVSGLTFGDNGFYLDFEDSANLGNDANGGTDFTTSGLAATDQATDTPTNNFCTLNPLVPTTNITFSEGNCKMATHPSSDTYGGGIGTFGLTAGKWYWEIKMASLLGNHTHGVISELTAELYQNVTGLQMDTGVTNFRNDDGGEMIKDGTQTTADYGIFDDGDIMGIAFNADDNQISIYDNGSAIVSNYAISTTRGTLFPYIGSGINTTFEVNFGGCPAFAITSGNADANGYGNMEFAVPENYYVLCSANLAEFGG